MCLSLEWVKLGSRVSHTLISDLGEYRMVIVLKDSYETEWHMRKNQKTPRTIWNDFLVCTVFDLCELDPCSAYEEEYSIWRPWLTSLRIFNWWSRAMNKYYARKRCNEHVSVSFKTVSFWDSESHPVIDWIIFFQCHRDCRERVRRRAFWEGKVSFHLYETRKTHWGETNNHKTNVIFLIFP